MNWHTLTQIEQLEQIKQESQQYPILIFKHSTRCSISAAALGRFERNWKHEAVGDLKPYFLDLIAYRNISNAIAEMYDVVHESPQVLLIHQGQCVYDTSHFDISFEALSKQLNALNMVSESK
ncbi:MAG: bacillithiol system redox-active protein YtxJ [Runella sp.]